MSEDQRRDGDRGRTPEDMSDMFSKGPGGAADSAEDTGRPGAKGATADPAAAERAAKQDRVRKRREEMRRRRDAAQGLVPPAGGAGGQRAARGSALPALRPDIRPDTPALRAERVEAIRRDLVRRRRRKGMGTLLKLFLFVLLPTTLVAAFLFFHASGLYRSESSFSVRSSDMGAAGGGPLGALIGGGGGILYDPIAVQTFITSRDVLKRLDAEHGWIAQYKDPRLDFYHRIEPTASFEEAFEHYLDLVTVSYDPTEGIIQMSLVATTAGDARLFSEAIIGYAEEMVDQLSDRIRRDALADSETYFKEAETNLRTAQLALAEAQKMSEVFSVESEVAGQMALIAQLESQREAEKARLASLLRVTGGDDPRVLRKEAAIETLESQIRDLRANIAGGARDQATLADINARMVTAKLEVETKMAIFASALERLEIARTEAARQHRYLAIVSRPSLPDKANYPRKIELTALAFLGFLGFYIIGSLTVSLIREQASI